MELSAGGGLKNQPFFVDIINPLTTSVPHHTETSELICMANQFTGFYMMRNIGRWVNGCFFTAFLLKKLGFLSMELFELTN